MFVILQTTPQTSKDICINYHLKLLYFIILIFRELFHPNLALESRITMSKLNF